MISTQEQYNLIAQKYQHLRDWCIKNYEPQQVQQIELQFQTLSDLDYADEQEKIKSLLQVLDITVIVIEMLNLDFPSLLAALLFEAYEKGRITDENIANKEVLSMVKGIVRLSKISMQDVALEQQSTENKGKKDVRQESKLIAIQNENLIKLLITLGDDIRSLLVRLAFRLDIMRKLGSKSEEEQRKNAKETSKIHAPVAHRLGLYKIKTELEELAMKYSEGEMYRFIAKKLSETKINRTQFIENFISPIRNLLKENGLNCEVKGRPKSISSIWNKMKNQGVGFEEVYDLFAIRVILKNTYPSLREEKEDCWKVYSLITDIYPTNSKRLRDWISAPKGSGYESLHTTVMSREHKWVEVQIRTQRMDDVAERGMAAHWKYKENTTQGHQGFEGWLAKIRENLENPDRSNDDTSPEKRELYYSDEIFVFTPKRELKKINAKGTVLDFAFSVHTNLGMQCTGAKVNGKLQALDYQLKNGDEVEIMTSKNQRPKSEWLKFITSKRASLKIKHFLEEQQFKNVGRGKEILQYKCEQLKVEFNDKILRKLLNYYSKYKTLPELYEAVGKEELDIAQIKNIISERIEEVKELKEPEKPVDIQAIINYEQKLNKDCLVLDKQSDFDYEMAKCCHPVRGDEIFGFVTVNKGTKIHKRSCPNASDMMLRFPYRVIEAQWTSSDKLSNFATNIRILGSNRQGILQDVIRVIGTDFHLNIISINAEKSKKTFNCGLCVNVNTLQQLELLLQKLHEIKDVNKVYRE